MISHPEPQTAAEALLRQLKANGIDYLFANAGTDFAPIIEAYAGAPDPSLYPQPLTIPHESAAVAMAHGFYLTTGKPQAVMAHVNVGLANCAMGLMNAASDNIPIVMLAGRTPITEYERPGARMNVIQHGQEMRDQAGVVRELVKWDYEMRYGDQATDLVDRAIAIASATPRGPVLLSLPREPLCERWAPDQRPSRVSGGTAGHPFPDPNAIREAAKILSSADRPIIITQRGDPDGTLGGALADFADENAIPVIEFRPIRNVLPFDHPMHGGNEFAPWLPDADAVLVVDSPVPWIKRDAEPAPNARVIHIGPDPHFARLPGRHFQSHVAIAGDPTATIRALSDALRPQLRNVSARHRALTELGFERRRNIRKDASRGNGAPMSAAYVGLCLSDAIDEETIVFNEMGVPPDVLCPKAPNRVFTPTYAGGLGWGLPAALGAKIAAPDRMVVACIGDGSHIFANPVACHQVSEALGLPILILVLNNGRWNAVQRATLDVFPNGRAAASNKLPLTSLEPSPSFADIILASRGYGERVESGDDLPSALAAAIKVVRNERRQALLDIAVA